MADRSEMARNAIESDFRTTAEKNKQILYRSEMARIAIESEFQISKMADRSEMARNAIKSDFRTFKMSAGGHFVKICSNVHVCHDRDEQEGNLERYLNIEIMQITCNKLQFCRRLLGYCVNAKLL